MEFWRGAGFEHLKDVLSPRRTILTKSEMEREPAPLPGLPQAGGGQKSGLPAAVSDGSTEVGAQQQKGLVNGPVSQQRVDS